MTERLADISRRIDSVQQLESVVTAMRGIAAARAQQARAKLPGVRAYAQVIAGAIAQALPLLPRDDGAGGAQDAGAVIVFCAEQGFVGAFNEHVLDALDTHAPGTTLFLIGARGVMLAEERQLPVAWHAGMAPHVEGIPALANSIADALDARIATSHLARVDLVFPVWLPGERLHVQARALLPFDFTRFAAATPSAPPLTTLPAPLLLARLAEEYVFAELCEAAMSAFAAENEARVAAMVAAKGNVARFRDELEALARRVRQDEITAEVVELASAADSAQNPNM